MEVATLTARLEAEVSRFQANMRIADAVLETLSGKMDNAEKDAETLSSALKRIEIANRQVVQSVQNLSSLNRALGGSKQEAEDVVKALRDIHITAATVAENAVASAAIENQLEDVRNAAVEAKIALGDMGGVLTKIRSFGPAWGRLAWAMPPAGSAMGATGLGTYNGGTDLLPYHYGNPMFQNRIFNVDPYGFVRNFNPRQYDSPAGPMTLDQYLTQNATPREGMRMVGSFGNIPDRYLRAGMGTREADKAVMAVKRSTGEFVQAFESELGRGDVKGATDYLKSRGITFRSEGAGGGYFRRTGETENGIAAAFGAGGGGGIRIPWFLRGGFGGFGPRRLFPGMAPFGSVLGLAGFGAERALFSSLGIAGSMGGGLLGGGLLGAGALGTAAVGMGTDLAGIGQAAGDIHTVSGDLGKLSDAIAKYGKNSRQAADAQLQLNADLKGFSPVARSAVLQAAKTSQSFKDMFDKLTGPAEKTGAQIINQGIQVGQKFLPTIGKFAAENMKIIQVGIQPLFKWLQQPKGGLGIFTDLEKIFQKNLPTSIHALTQGFELFLKVIDTAAHRTGGFFKALDTFFTKWNSAGNFPKVAKEVNNLISLFETWLHLFTALGGAIYYIFKPAVNFGQQFAAGLTQIINKIKEWLALRSTQRLLNDLFSAHLAQLQAIFKIITNLLPAIEAMTTAFLQVEIQLSNLAAGGLRMVADLIRQIMKIPFAKQILGWAAALFLMQKAIRGVLTLLGLSGILGALKSLIAVRIATAMESDVLSVAALGAAAEANAAKVGILRTALLALASPEVLAAIAAAAAATGGAYLLYKYAKTQGPVGGSALQPNLSLVDINVALKATTGKKHKELEAARAWLIAHGKDMIPASEVAALDKQFGFVPPTGQLPHGDPRDPGGTRTRTRKSTDLPVAPARLMNAVYAAEAGHGNLEKANAAVYAYFQGLLKHPGRFTKTSIYQAEVPFAPAPPTQSAGTPPASTGSAGGTLASLIGGPLAAQLSNAQGAAATGRTKNLQHLLDTEKKVLAALNAQHVTGKQLVQQARERATIEKEIAATQKKLHAARGSGIIDRILGLGSGTSSGQLSIEQREQKIMLNQLERLLGGKHHSLGVAASALGITPSRLANESLKTLMKQLEKNGYKFDATTLSELKKIKQVLDITHKDHLKLTPTETKKITGWLTAIDNTLKGTGKGIRSNYVPTSPESIVGRIAGLTLAQRLGLEQAIAQSQAHHGMRPTGTAAGGLPLTAGNQPITVHGDIVIQSNATSSAALAKDIRAKLIRNSRRNATQTRGPNAGRSVGLN